MRTLLFVVTVFVVLGLRPVVVAQGQSPLRLSHEEMTPRTVIPQMTMHYTIADLDDWPAPIASQAASHQLQLTTLASDSRPGSAAGDVAALERDIFALFEEAERAGRESVPHIASDRTVAIDPSTGRLPE